jgi:hypothetical protein
LDPSGAQAAVMNIYTNPNEKLFGFFLRCPLVAVVYKHPTFDEDEDDQTDKNYESAGFADS